MSSFQEIFGGHPGYLFSAPGRTELGGNHTDHQHGKTLAAAVTMDCTAQVAENNSDIIRVFSEGFGECSVSLNELYPVQEEQGKTIALIRGIAAAFRGRGYEVKGFNAYVRSNVRSGSGLSSSAAFEMLIASVIDHFCGSGLDATELAKIGVEAENDFFGKPCGMMDQLASACGGIVEMDFADPDQPKHSGIDFDFSSSGYSLCIVDSGADHAGLTGQYAAVTEELYAVCAFFGKKYLRDVPEREFYAHIKELRNGVGDRAVMRAMHVYEENRRVEAQAAALRRGDIEGFLTLVESSGQSSWELLQNVVPERDDGKQELAFTISLCKRLLKGRGACRVHGGGFAGTVQAYVPNELLSDFCDSVDSVLGAGSCSVVEIRKNGAGLVQRY